MYCKSCGAQFESDEAVICLKCGVRRGGGTGFCPNCGNQTAENAAVCLNCGMSLQSGAKTSGGAGDEAKSKMVAGLLGIFLGQFGVHNFYLGYTTKAVIQLVASVVGYLGICILTWVFFIGLFCIPVPMGIAVWGLIEGIMIMTGKINTDAKGNFLKD